MCEICHHRMCPSSCPSAIDRVVGVCALCGEVIRASEPGLIVDGDTYHTECLENMPPKEMLCHFEHQVTVFGEEE